MRVALHRGATRLWRKAVGGYPPERAAINYRGSSLGILEVLDSRSMFAEHRPGIAEALKRSADRRSETLGSRGSEGSPEGRKPLRRSLVDAAARCILTSELIPTKNLLEEPICKVHCCANAELLLSLYARLHN